MCSIMAPNPILIIEAPILNPQPQFFDKSQVGELKQRAQELLEAWDTETPIFLEKKEYLGFLKRI